MDAESFKIIAIKSAHCRRAHDIQGKFNEYAGCLERQLVMQLLKELQPRISVVALVFDGAVIYRTLLNYLKAHGFVDSTCQLILDPWHFCKSHLLYYTTAIKSTFS